MSTQLREIQSILEAKATPVAKAAHEKFVPGTKEKIYISYPNFHSDVKIGNTILIDDGKLEVSVLNIENSLLYSTCASSITCARVQCFPFL